LLHSQGRIVYLISGGFRQMIEPVADQLYIPFHRLYANRLLFASNGDFGGFDAEEPTSRDGGKPAVVKSLIDAHGYKPIVMIGDGATDLQARPPADAFVGFGGIIVREKVEKEADWFIRDFQDLITLLKR